ncbi:hypothetical protein IMCC1989_2577 [gamma proteobacterium IMCC1989]|nr:hypothetical protein IMCC1989_2577 [gamma proteobacterium IMCC1989]
MKIFKRHITPRLKARACERPSSFAAITAPCYAGYGHC